MINDQTPAKNPMLDRNSEVDLLDWLRRNWRQDGTRMKYLNSCWDRELRCVRYWPNH